MEFNKFRQSPQKTLVMSNPPNKNHWLEELNKTNKIKEDIKFSYFNTGGSEIINECYAEMINNCLDKTKQSDIQYLQKKIALQEQMIEIHKTNAEKWKHRALYLMYIWEKLNKRLKKMNNLFVNWDEVAIYADGKELHNKWRPNQKNKDKVI